MNSLTFDLSKSTGKFKVMNAVNGGPCHRRDMASQTRSTLEDYKALQVPYCRTQEANYGGCFGRPYTYNISDVFPNFDADPDDPASYDFVCTDEAIAIICLEAGAKLFYRLGEAKEPQPTRHATFPPKDFQKWAKVCEHIIRHYTDGWADGYTYDIEYWEIWNEPDLNEEEPDRRFAWGGTREQFFDLYEITSKYLKQRFPHLKIGGPALSGNMNWAEDFLKEMEKRNAPIDFFSWHSYCKEPEEMLAEATALNQLLQKYHYESAERILDEWNYLRGRTTEDYVYSFKTIRGIKGAAFEMACMSAMQNSGQIDMMMYYDMGLSDWNGIFDFYSFERLKGYYPLYWYSEFYHADEVKAEEEMEHIYSLCGVDEHGKVLSVITYYSDNDTLENKTVSLDFGRKGQYEIYLLDEQHDGELIAVTDTLKFDMKLYSTIFIKEAGEV